MDLLRRLARQAMHFIDGPAEGYDAPRIIALRTRTLCAEHGPHEIAAAIGAPPEVTHPRFIAYLLAASALNDEENTRELAVEQAVRGFEEWKAQRVDA